MDKTINTIPTGTVTFLFTDIEGSTKLWQQFPQAMPVAHARHHEILKQAIEAHHGHVFQIIGDAFCASFATVRNALDACVAAQRMLHAETWGETGALRVRMGLHTGTAEWHEGDYHGYLTMARVQRIMSLAHGGQILLSNATAELLRGQLSQELHLRDMGEHALKGLAGHEHVWQLIADDLPSELIALASRDAIPNNLPVQLTSFIGRTREQQELQHLLSRSRLRSRTAFINAWVRV